MKVVIGITITCSVLLLYGNNSFYLANKKQPLSGFNCGDASGSYKSCSMRIIRAFY